MHTIEETVEIAVPVRTAYDQWTQLKSFPRFMSAVKRVDQVRPTVTRWVIGCGPVRRAFTAEIVEQRPDSCVAWQSLDRRTSHRGEVSFRPTAPDRTTVTVRMEVGPRGAAALLMGASREVTRRVVRSELGHFKEFIEGLGEAGGAWRGTIRNGHVQPAEPEPPRSRVARWPTG
ncbi:MULTISPECIES: SRPBCC family protein [unclassified Streptomyces]|uniref:SRPBCC family protein n=1 Tax=unclassified Streptomyces TaxID=2593676 RepID=UPI0021C857E7|nr:SRPBCC family protein [Streptomyces sp. FIT100]UUN26754.1 SRPBCC family protein [Streptomyces sp. FIT100]